MPNLRLFAVTLAFLAFVTSGHGRADECDRLLKIDDDVTWEEVQEDTGDIDVTTWGSYSDSKAVREKACVGVKRYQKHLGNLRDRRRELERVCGSRLTQDCNSQCWEKHRVKWQPMVDAACAAAALSDEEFAAKNEKEKQQYAADARKAEDALYDKPEKLVERTFNLGEQQYTFHLPASYKQDESMSMGIVVNFTGPLLWQGFTLYQLPISLDKKLKSNQELYAEDLKRPDDDPHRKRFARTETTYSFDSPTRSVLGARSQCPSECSIEIHVDTKGTSGQAILKALKQDLENGQFVSTVSLPAQKLEKTTFNIKDCKYTFRLPQSVHYEERMSKRDLGEMHFSDGEFNFLLFTEGSDTGLEESFAKDSKSKKWAGGEVMRQNRAYFIEKPSDESRLVAKNPCLANGILAVDIQAKLATGKAILKAMKEDLAGGKFASVVPRTKNQIKRDNEEARKRQEHENHNACLLLMSAADRLPEEEVRAYLKQCSNSDSCSFAKEEMQEKSKVNAADLNCKN
jgi:hypothetical protein